MTFYTLQAAANHSIGTIQYLFKTMQAEPWRIKMGI